MYGFELRYNIFFAWWRYRIFWWTWWQNISRRHAFLHFGLCSKHKLLLRSTSSSTSVYFWLSWPWKSSKNAIMQDTEAVHLSAGTCCGAFGLWLRGADDYPAPAVAEGPNAWARMASPAMGFPVRGVDQDRTADWCHSTNGNSWRLIPQAWAHCSRTKEHRPQRSIAAQRKKSESSLAVVDTGFSVFVQHGLRIFQSDILLQGRTWTRTIQTKLFWGRQGYCRLVYLAFITKAVPAGVFSALANILGAEVGPIIDFVTERRGGL